MRGTGVILAAAVVAGMAWTARAAESPLMVSLGDSYAAASGLDPNVSPIPRCWRSGDNAAHVVARTRGYRLVDASCGNATTADITGRQFVEVAPQIGAVTAEVSLVTLSLGANDGQSFVATILGCALTASFTHGHGDPCTERYGDRFTDPALYRHLVGVLDLIHSRARGARVVITGYPWISPATGPGCWPAVPFADGDLRHVRLWEQHLNGVVASAAAATGTLFADLGVSSEGHDACEPVGRRWIEPVEGSRQLVPLHPNRAGERAVAAAILARLG